MRKSVRMLLTAAAVAALTTPVSLPTYAADAEMDRLVESICSFATANDRSALRKKLDSADLDLRRIYGGITCSGKSLLRATTAAGALDTATFIATKLGKSLLMKPEADGLNIVQWTEKEIAAGDAATKAKLQPLLDLYKSEPQ